jgi:hypothetical protein
MDNHELIATTGRQLNLCIKYIHTLGIPYNVYLREITEIKSEFVIELFNIDDEKFVEVRKAYNRIVH